MIQGSASAYASILNATLFPFLLYQQSLATATRVALGSLQAATGASRVAQQAIEAGDETHRQDTEPIGQAAQGNVETTGRVALQQNVEATGETAQESGVEVTEQTPAEVEEVASGLAELVPPPPEPENTVDELPPSPAPEVLDEPAAEAGDETDPGGRETSSRADGEGGEAYPGPSAPGPSPPAQEGSVTPEDPPPAQEEELLTDETITEELPASPEVSNVELPPPLPVPQNTHDELPSPPPISTASNALGSWYPGS